MPEDDRSAAPAHSSGAYQWQKSRQRPDVNFAGASPIQGFGPGGAYTLWLTPAKVSRRVEFVGGRPEIKISGPAVDDPELRDLRERVIDTIQAINNGGRQILRADLTLLEYGAAIVSRHYAMSDEDLTLLFPLSGSPKWPEQLVIHALGGVENRDALAKLGRSTSRETPPAADELQAEAIE